MPRPPTCDCGACKKCKRRAYMREWQRAHPGYAAESERKRRAEKGDELRAKDRERYYRDHEKRKAANRERVKAWRRANPEKQRAIRRAEYARNRDRRRAYKIVARALTNGQITKPDACQECGTAATGQRLHAHHHDYTKPLEVRWLCPDCHGLEHRNHHEEDPVR